MAAGSSAGDLAALQDALDNLRAQNQSVVQGQATRFDAMTRDMLPLPRVAVSDSVHVPPVLGVEHAFSALDAAFKAAGIGRDRSRSRSRSGSPSQISPNSQAVPPEELQPVEEPPEEEALQPAYVAAPEEDEEALQPDEQAYGAEPEEDWLEPDEQAYGAAPEEEEPASARAGAQPKWWPADPPPAIHPTQPPAAHPKSYWRAGSQRFGARGSLQNPNVIWHSLRAKARREGWLEDFGRENSKLFLFARPGPEQKSR